MTLGKVKHFDYDSYISAIFAPRHLWDDISAILEFNIEIATIKSKVSEVALGFIRLQWWRDSIENIFSKNNILQSHPVVLKLKNLSLNHSSIKKEDFLELLSAREKDFLDYPFGNQEELLDYVDRTAFGVNNLVFKVINDQENIFIEEIIRDYSVAWGLTAIIRAYSSNISKGRKIIPENLSVWDIVKIAEDKICLARAKLKSLDKKEYKDFIPALLKGRIAEFYLKQMRDQRFDINKPDLKSLEGLGVIKIALAASLNRL